jgi:hypothetical protein
MQAGGSERHPHRDLALTPCCPGHEHPCDARTHHPQQGCQSPEQQTQRPAELLTERKRSFCNRHDESLASLASILLGPLIHAGEFRLRLRHSHPLAEVSNNGEPPVRIEIG